MKLSNKYNIAPEDFKRMVDDGLISCQWPTYEKIYEEFQALQVNNNCKSCLYADLSVKHKLSERSIRNIISIIGKI